MNSIRLRGRPAVSATPESNKKVTIIESVIFATVQGMTEFLPVSSSGHVIIFSKLLNIRTPDLYYQAFLHAGSLLAVIVVFRGDLVKLFSSEKRTAVFVLLGAIPVLVMGFFLKERIIPFFTDTGFVGYFLITNSLLLLAGSIKLHSSYKVKPLNIRRTLAVGIMQVLALFPGISRSGTTISCAALLGMDRIEAYRFSFLMFIPIGVSVLVYDLLRADNLILDNGIAPLILGFITAFLLSIVALKLLYSILTKSKLYVFSIYCFIVGILSIIRS